MATVRPRSFSHHRYARCLRCFYLRCCHRVLPLLLLLLWRRRRLRRPVASLTRYAARLAMGAAPPTSAVPLTATAPSDDVTAELDAASPPTSKTPLRSNLTLVQAPLPSELEGGAPVTVASDDYSVSLA